MINLQCCDVIEDFHVQLAFIWILLIWILYGNNILRDDMFSNDKPISIIRLIIAIQSNDHRLKN